MILLFDKKKIVRLKEWKIPKRIYPAIGASLFILMMASILEDESKEPSTRQPVTNAYGPFRSYSSGNKSEPLAVIANPAVNPQIAVASTKDETTTNVYGPFYTYPTSESYHKASPQSSVCNFSPLIEVKAGYFFFTDSKMRKVFNQGGLDLQVALSYPLWKWAQIYLAGERVEKKGRAVHCQNRTHFWDYMASLGLKGVVCVSPKTQWYLTVGPRYFYVHVHNNSPHVDRKLNRSTVGGFVGTGFNFFPIEHLAIDVFGEYSYGRINFNANKGHVYGETRQVGGFAFGGGLGYAF